MRRKLRHAFILAITDLSRTTHWCCQFVNSNPVKITSDEPAREDIASGANNDLVFNHIERHNVKWLSSSYPQALALPDCIKRDTFMTPKHPALPVYNIARPQTGRILLSQIGLIVIMRHKADLLAVRFVSYWQLKLLSQLTSVNLRHAAQRQQKMFQGLLIQMIQGIRLILMCINAFFQKRTSILRLLNACIVTCSQIVCA